MVRDLFGSIDLYGTDSEKSKRKKFSRTDEKVLYEKFQHKCAICNRLTEFDDGEVDHINL